MNMEITYIGHSCFKLKGKNLTVVIDPYDPAKLAYKLPKLEAAALLLSHHHFDHDYVQGVTGYKLLVDGPGEYETNEVFIYGIPTFHDNKEGAERGKNTIYLIEMGVENSIKKEEKLKISSKSDLPEDTEIVILTPQH